MPEPLRRPLTVRRLGTIAYGEALELQAHLVGQRQKAVVGDHLLLLEHPHVITMGTSFRAEHLLRSREDLEGEGVSLFEIGRGGDVTYHGPGQLVAYPILRLAPDRKDLHRYLRDLEEVILRTLALFGIRGHREQGLTGVWVPEGKVAAIGVRVSSGWVTSHGLALNVDPDLSQFDAIVPCGIQGRRVTSMTRVLGHSVAVADVMDPLVEAFTSVFDRDLIVV